MYGSYYRPKWFKYPRAQPPENGTYIVTLAGTEKSQAAKYTDGIWTSGRKQVKVIAWMFFPGAYGTPGAED